MNFGTPQEMYDEDLDFKYKIMKEDLKKSQEEFLELSTGDKCTNLNLNIKRNGLYRYIKLLKHKLTQ